MVKKILIVLIIVLVSAFASEQVFVDVDHELFLISANFVEGNTQEAISSIRVLLLVTQNAHIYYTYGMINKDLGREKLTLKAFEKGIKHSDLTPEIVAGIGAYFSQQGQPEKAIEVYEKGRTIFKSNLSLYTNLGELYFETKQYQKNIDMFEELRTLVPGLVNPISYYLGLSYYALGKDNKALDYFVEANEAGVENADIYLKIGDLQAQNDKFQKAVAAYRNAEEYGVVEAQMFNNLGYCLLQLNQEEDALAYLVKARDEGYSSEAFYQTFAVISFSLKDYELLTSTLNPVYESLKEKKEVSYFLAKGFDALRDNERALFYYQEALAHGSDKNPDYINDRIDSLSEF